MKAYGLVRLLKETFGISSYVRDGDGPTDPPIIEIQDGLMPRRLRALQEFAEEKGWEVGTTYEYGGHTVELTEINGKEYPHESTKVP
jgi:hypothetical protein